MTEKRYYFVGEKSKQNQAAIELVESWRSAHRPGRPQRIFDTRLVKKLTTAIF